MAGLELFVRGKQALFGLVIALRCTCEYTLKAVLVNTLSRQCCVSMELLLPLAGVQMFFGHCGEGDKWVPFSWLMMAGISRHSSRGGEGKMMENLLRK